MAPIRRRGIAAVEGDDLWRPADGQGTVDPGHGRALGRGHRAFNLATKTSRSPRKGATVFPRRLHWCRRHRRCRHGRRSVAFITRAAAKE